MPNNSALKTDLKAKQVLLSQIEKFAHENDIDTDRLYDIGLAEEIFIPELKILQRKLKQYDDVCKTIMDADHRKHRSNWELTKINEAHKLTKHSTWFSEPMSYYNDVSSMHYIAAHKRANFRRRVWEILTFLEACYERHLLVVRAKKDALLFPDQIR